MELFRIKNDIPFMRHALVFNIISVVTFLLAVLFLFTRGLSLSVEFTGGTLVEVQYEQAADLEKVRQALTTAGYSDVTVQHFGSSKDVLIRLPLKSDTRAETTVPEEKGEQVMAALKTAVPGATLRRVEVVGPLGGKSGGVLVELQYPEATDLEKVRQALVASGYADAAVQHSGSARDVLIRLPLQSAVAEDKEVVHQGDMIMSALEAEAPGATLRRVEQVGPQVGRELAENGALALLLVIVGIMIYLAFRFEWRFAVSAIIANLHDVIIILGFFAFFQWEFSLSVLAAILAVLGYSVNESVVVFDRVRETFRKVRGMTTPQVLDHAITRTISRTIITHGSTQMMVLSMLIFGGETLFYFALALTVGICFGIYSSVLVASPLVMWLGVSREQFVKPKREIQGANRDGAVV